MKNNNRNIFNISDGNLEVFKLMPEMMGDLEFRQKLRKLTLEFIQKKQRELYKGERIK